jgi:hypothetical protein
MMTVTTHGPVEQDDQANNENDHNCTNYKHQESNLLLVSRRFPLVAHELKLWQAIKIASSFLIQKTEVQPFKPAEADIAQTFQPVRKCRWFGGSGFRVNTSR